MKNFIKIYLLLASVNLFSQEKITPSISGEVEKVVKDTTMPKLENPEFVITKEEYLTPQLVDRQLADEEKIYRVSTKSVSMLPNTVQQKKPLHSLQKDFEIMSGKVFLSYGNYSTPHIEGLFGKNYSTSGILFHGLLYNTNGHLPNAERQKGIIELGGNVTLLDYENSLSFLNKSRAQIKLGINTDNFGLYGSIDSSKKRSVNNFNINGNILQSDYLTTLIENPISFQFGFGFNTLKVSDYTDLIENKFSLLGSSSATINSTTYQLFTNYQSSSLQEVHQSYFFKTGINFDYRFDSKINSSIELSQVYYRGSLENSNSQFGGSLQINYQYSNPLQLTFNFLRDVKQLSILDYLEINPFLSSSTELQHMEVPLQLSAGSLYKFSEKIQIRGELVYRNSTSRPFYKSDSLNMFNINYFESKEVSINTVLSYQNNSNHNLMISAKYNLPVDSLEVLPFIPIIEINLKYNIPQLYFENLASNFDIYFSTPRAYGFKESDGKTENILKFSVKFDYTILSNLNAVFKIENLLNSKYELWKRYKEPGRFISLGAAYRW